MGCITGNNGFKMEWDGDKWSIETDGTNQTDWAERIDGADKTYRTVRMEFLE